MSNVSALLRIIHPIILHWGRCVTQTSVSFLSKELDGSVVFLSLSLALRTYFHQALASTLRWLTPAIQLLLKSMELLQRHSGVNLFAHCFQWDQYPWRHNSVDSALMLTFGVKTTLVGLNLIVVYIRMCFNGGYSRKTIPLACKYTISPWPFPYWMKIFPAEGPPSAWFSCLKNMLSREKDINLEFHLKMTLTFWH